MKVTDLSADDLRNLFTRLMEKVDDIPFEEKLAITVESDHLRKLFNDNKDLNEAVHKIAHMTLHIMDLTGDLHHMSLCDIVMSCMVSFIPLSLMLTEGSTKGPLIPESFDNFKFDKSKVN